MLLAKPRDKQMPDSLMDTTDMDTIPSVLKGPQGASQEANQVILTFGTHQDCICYGVCP